MSADPRSSRTIIGVIIAVLLVVGIVLAGSVWMIIGTGEDTAATSAVVTTADSFPLPAGASVSLPPSTGQRPPSAVRAWHTGGTLAEACEVWRDALRGWADNGGQDLVTGEVLEGVACSFDSTKNGLDVDLRVASYAGETPEATLTVTDDSGNS